MVATKRRYVYKLMENDIYQPENLSTYHYYFKQTNKQQTKRGRWGFELFSDQEDGAVTFFCKQHLQKVFLQ